VQRRVQFAVLLQLADAGAADPVATSSMVPGTDHRDFEAALEHLLYDGSIEAPPSRLEPLPALATQGRLTLTARGHTRLDGDDV
jgi:hypothetical protein